MSPDSSPIQPSPSKRQRISGVPQFTILEDEDASSDLEPLGPVVEESPIPASILRTRTLGSTARILHRSFGGILGVGRGRLRDHCMNWVDQTAPFYTGPEDLFALPNRSMPFCTASCNTNSLVAIGDEDGWVRLLDTDEAQSSVSKVHVSLRAHVNAVMDVEFSSDDLYLATASGDQTAHVMDVRTQECVSILAKHTSSVKQVRFRPGDDKVLVTSSRDGTVQIWDLRCSGGTGTVHTVWGEHVSYASTVRTLSEAHADSFVSETPSGSVVNGLRYNGKSEAYSRRGDVSITAVSFLSSDRAHLFLTASDASTCVKLWDIRGRYSSRGPAVPVSTTRQPESHNRHRHFAINSLALSGDGARFYALCRDNTVYAYSTSHLVLGHAPELAVSDSARYRHASIGKEGLGPIYGFRHRNFHAASFFVKASLRKAAGDKPELLAVGSTDGCPVLFPTDETFLKEVDREHSEDMNELPQSKPGSASPFLRSNLMRTPSGTGFSARMTDTIPIYEHGTPLIRGHEAEVTSVTWTKDGALVSVGDDYRARCWREGPQAKELRLSGEAEGRRWHSGWADVEAGYDDEE